MFDWVIYRPGKYWNFQSETTLEQIIAVVTMHSVFFFTLNCFSEAKLAKTALILIKQNLRYTLNFSVTPYFEKILCIVAPRFIWEVILYQ